MFLLDKNEIPEGVPDAVRSALLDIPDDIFPYMTAMYDEVGEFMGIGFKDKDDETKVFQVANPDIASSVKIVEDHYREELDLRRIVRLVHQYYATPEGAGGGSLHIFLEDGNSLNGHIQFCRDFAYGKGDHLGVVLANMILELTEDQRDSLLDILDRLVR